jgi:hypothetical protein
LPHVPQWVVCETSVSQMSAGLAVQCANPEAHDVVGTEQTPALHVTPAGPMTCGFVVQSFPHAPQFFASVCTLVHVPEHDVLAEGGHEHPVAPDTQGWPVPPSAPVAVSLSLVVASLDATAASGVEASVPSGGVRS